MQKKFIHYDIKVAESNIYIWYLRSTGSYYKIVKSSRKVIELKGYIKNGDLCIKLRGKEHMLKNLIARTFLYPDKGTFCVALIDGDANNCSVDNLICYSQKLHGKLTGYRSRSKPVIIQENKNEPIEFRSIREAAKHLHCSYQTLLDYLSGKVYQSVLKKYGRKIFYKRGELC